jgi:hypothetical protein
MCWAATSSTIIWKCSSHMTVAGHRHERIAGSFVAQGALTLFVSGPGDLD